MVNVGLDVAKDKHDCFILDSDGEVLADVFTIPNTAEGLRTLWQAICRCTHPEDKIQVGLEATGHYSYNSLGFLLDKGLPTYVINPLHTNLYGNEASGCLQDFYWICHACQVAGAATYNPLSFVRYRFLRLYKLELT